MYNLYVGVEYKNNNFQKLILYVQETQRNGGSNNPSPQFLIVIEISLNGRNLRGIN